MVNLVQGFPGLIWESQIRFSGLLGGLRIQKSYYTSGYSLFERKGQIKINGKKHVGQGLGDTEQAFGCPLPSGVM